MASPDKPKRRLVTYVTEEVYEKLNSEAKEFDRSISSIAEMKINLGLDLGTVRHGPAQTDPEDMKNSVIETITNLPEENLQIFAEKLSRVLGQHEPAQPGTDYMKNSVIETITNLPEENLQILAEKLSRILDRHGPVQGSTEYQSVSKPILEKRWSKEIIPRMDMNKVQDLAKRLMKFIHDNGLTQRSFKQEYGMDITQLSRWERGTKSMSEETFSHFEKIISNSSI